MWRFSILISETIFCILEVTYQSVTEIVPVPTIKMEFQTWRHNSKVAFDAHNSINFAPWKVSVVLTNQNFICKSFSTLTNF